MKLSDAVLVQPRIQIAVRGTKGRSAYEVAVANGFVGTEAEWLASLVLVPASPILSTSTSFTASDDDHNSHGVCSGTGQTLTLDSSASAGICFSRRFTTAWVISCPAGLSKDGNDPTGVTGGSIAANTLVSFLHEGAGAWIATGGDGLT